MNPSAIVKHCDEKIFHHGNVYCRYNANIVHEFSGQFFEPSYWQEKQAVIGTAQGRGTTYFVEFFEQQWVLKHYYRGGMIGRIINDTYLFTGYDNTRAAKEYQLMKALERLNLPAPKAVGFRVVKSGIGYRADMITERIVDAQDLVTLLGQKSLPGDMWRKIGACIKQFHAHGIYHDDLNIHNILIDEQDKVWLIDFDRGEQRAIQSSWQQHNMDRLLRSFKKERNKLATMYWQTNDWQTLLSGYNNTP